MSRLQKLKDLKSEGQDLRQSSYVEDLIMGNGSSALLCFLHLKSLGKNPSLLCDYLPNVKSMLSSFWGPLSFIRGDEFKEELEDAFPNLRLEGQTKTPVFYKDQKISSFAGKRSSMKLLNEESYFTKPGHKSNILEKILALYDQQFASLEELEKQILDQHFDATVSAVFLPHASEEDWMVETGNHQQIKCKQLYWCRNARELYKSIKNPQVLHEKSLQYFASITNQAALRLSFSYPQEIYPAGQTIFLPLSQTHEEGHFIGEFQECTEQGQRCTFLCFVEEEASTDDLAKKVRLLKRQISKAIPDIEMDKLVAKVSFVSDQLSSTVSDQSFLELHAQFPSLFIVHQSGGVLTNSVSKKSPKALTRELLCFRQMQRFVEAQS